MKTLNIAQARSEFSALVDEVRLGGEGVIISKYGRPAAMIVSYRPEVEGKVPKRDWRAERGVGYADWRHPFRGQPFKIDSHFDDPMDDMWSVFTEEPEDFTK